ncbi:MAG TPA: FtsX-like permease family protein [Cyclobacteriaceae bacterium]|nr:FtsX-like permease family protein [Cyclobacteriaceae bacterium]
MNVPFFIARRYFLSKRKKNFINIISILSMAGVAFTTAALIIVLSVFNGLGVLLRGLYTTFDPELKIELVKGKSFPVSDTLLQRIQSTPGVKLVTEVIEDYAYVSYGGANTIVTLKGMSRSFIDQHRLDDHMIDGELALMKDSIPFAILGDGLRYTLSADVKDDMHALQVYYIRNTAKRSSDPTSMYTRKSIRPGGVFSIEKNLNENYMFVPIEFANELMNYGNRRTALEIQTTSSSVKEVQSLLQQRLGATFQVLTNEEQHRDLYRLLKFEKLFSFMALSLLLLIGSINIFFSLMMLAIDKKKDISILAALGATPIVIRNVFLAEGALITFIGAGIGLVLGAILVYLQDTIGLVGMGMDQSIVSNYPVRMEPSDFVLTGLVITFIAIAVSFRPATLAARSYSIDHL